MKTFSLHQELMIPRPLAEVFEFFSNAANLEELTPPWLEFRIVTPPPIEMRVGTSIDYRLKLRGIPFPWQSEITAWEPPHRFVDEQRRGPYRVWIHEHRFEEREGGTLCTDVVEYAVPGGTLVNRFMVAPDIAKVFAYRHERMREIFG